MNGCLCCDLWNQYSNCGNLPRTALGQTEKYSAPADVFRSSSNSGRWVGARKGVTRIDGVGAFDPVSPNHCYGTWMFALRRYCCKSRKSNDPENLAKDDFQTSMPLQGSAAQIRRAVVAFV